LGIDERQDHETPEEKKVIDPELFAHHPELNKGIQKHPLETSPEVVKPVFPISQANHGEEAENIPQKEPET